MSQHLKMVITGFCHFFHVGHGSTGSKQRLRTSSGCWSSFWGIGVLMCGGFFGCEMPMAGQWPGTVRSVWGNKNFINSQASSISFQTCFSKWVIFRIHLWEQPPSSSQVSGMEELTWIFLLWKGKALLCLTGQWCSPAAGRLSQNASGRQRQVSSKGKQPWNSPAVRLHFQNYLGSC